MADKRRVRKSIRQLQRVKTWQLLILFLLVAFVSATFLRLNNIGMIQRRDAVLAADKNGDISEIESRLYDLQRYSAQHMNAETGPFYLEGQYKREVQRRVDEAKQANAASDNVNVKADKVCKPQFTAWSQAYVQCFVNELKKYPPSASPTQRVTMPNTNLYRYDFSGPLWSPDFAGLSVLVGVGILVLSVARLLGLAILRLLLKRHYRGI